MGIGSVAVVSVLMFRASVSRRCAGPISSRALAGGLDGCAGCFAQVVGANEAEAGLGEEALALFDVGADEASDDLGEAARAAVEAAG